MDWQTIDGLIKTENNWAQAILYHSKSEALKSLEKINSWHILLVGHTLQCAYICLFTSLPGCLSVRQSICVYVCLSVCLSVCHTLHLPVHSVCQCTWCFCVFFYTHVHCYVCVCACFCISIHALIVLLNLMLIMFKFTMHESTFWVLYILHNVDTALLITDLSSTSMKY